MFVVEYNYMMQEFNVIAVSNVNDTRNTGAHFFNTLSSPLDLRNGEWEVGIKKMIYYNNFYTIIDEAIDICYFKIVSESLLIENTSAIPLHKLLTAFPHSKFSIEFSHLKDYEWSIKISFFDQTIPHYCKAIFKKDDQEILTREFDYTRDNYLNQDKNAMITWVFNVEFPTKINDAKYVLDIDHKFPMDSFKRFSLLPGSYLNIQDLLNQAIPQIDDISVTYDHTTNRIQIKSFPIVIHEIHLTNELNYTLGFKSNMLQAGIQKAEYSPQLNRGRFAFFIYCNMCDFMKVGDKEVQLLDVITIPKAEYGLSVSIDNYNPLYRPICMNMINEIEIGMYTDSGKLIEFNNETGNAKTLILLHFRRKV